MIAPPIIDGRLHFSSMTGSYTPPLLEPVAWLYIYEVDCSRLNCETCQLRIGHLFYLQGGSWSRQVLNHPLVSNLLGSLDAE